MGERIWGCKVGGQAGDDPRVADMPMRQAVTEVYKRITGAAPEFVFSGWGAELTEFERAVAEDREPEPPQMLSTETVDEMYSRLPKSEWVLVRGMLIKRIGDPPTPEDVEDFRNMAWTQGRGPIGGKRG